MLLFILCIGVPLLFGLWAQMKVQGAYKKFIRVPTQNGMTGADVATDILRAANISDVRVVETRGTLSDHYNPTNKTLALSPDVYRGSTVASAGIAAHEVGHAIQHARSYGAMKLRQSLVPVTGIASGASNFLILGGIIAWMAFSQALGFNLLLLGVICLLVLFLFQVVTLPVEFDASKRAKVILGDMGIVDDREMRGVDKVLDAAALTYVAAMVATLGTLLYYGSMLLMNRD